MKKKITVYLASLANTKFGLSPATVPLEIGYIKAYAMAHFPDTVDIRLFRTVESLYAAVREKEPDIIGCAWYGWNRSLTSKALTYIKSGYPDILTVVGGANAPETKEECLNDFLECPAIDVIIPNEGEIPFANLLENYTAYGRNDFFKHPIDGVFFIDKDTVVTGNPLSLVKDIDRYPSPYLEGYLDEFLYNDLFPIMQTARGCPYHCSYCVSGKHSWTKIRAFPTERVKAEIEYIQKKAKNHALRFTDENFGILERDLEIAGFIAEKRKTAGYPSALRLYTHKVLNERIKEIVLLLRDLLPLNISSQTLTPEVLKNIGRRNISLDNFQKAISWAHLNNINATTELIFGLPGESYHSFMNVINQLVALRVDSVVIGTLMMLKETEVDLPSTIEKYGYKLLYGMAECGYTEFDDFTNVELDVWAGESDSFTYEEYLRILLFGMIFEMFMSNGYFKEMVYMWENREVKVVEVINEILDRPQNYPLFSKQIQRLKTCIEQNLFKTKEEAYTFFGRKFSRDVVSEQYIGFCNHYILPLILKGEMIHPDNLDKTIHEVIQASLQVFERCDKGVMAEFVEEMEFAKALVHKVIIPFWEMPEEYSTVDSPYNLEAWRNNDYRGSLSRYKHSRPVPYRFKVQSMEQYRDFVKETADKPFYIQSEYFFRSFRTNNIRRYIVAAF